MPHFLERAWLVGSAGPAGGTIVHNREGGRVVGVRDVSCNITKGGRCGDKTFQKMLDSITIRLWMVKSSAEQFLLQQWVSYSPFTSHRCTCCEFPSGHESVNYVLPKSTIKQSAKINNLYTSQILMKGLCGDELKCPDVSAVFSYLQEVHELLGNYDLKYCFVDKYKGTGWSNCWSIVLVNACSV